MSETGRRSAGNPASRGWRDDPQRPGVQRYWDGDGWDETIPPRSAPMPAWKGARMIALGVLIALAVVFVVWRMTASPSAEDCAQQEHEVFMGERMSLDVECR